MRCSRTCVSSFNGHFFIRSMDLLALPAANADQAHAVQIAHDEVLPTTNTSFLGARCCAPTPRASAASACTR